MLNSSFFTYTGTDETLSLHKMHNNVIRWGVFPLSLSSLSEQVSYLAQSRFYCESSINLRIVYKLVLKKKLTLAITVMLTKRWLCQRRNPVPYITVTKRRKRLSSIRYSIHMCLPLSNSPFAECEFKILPICIEFPYVCFHSRHDNKD